MSEREWHVYALSDPRTGEVRYVGWSFTPSKRLRSHVNGCRRERTHKAHWIASLLDVGLRPQQRILESGQGDWAASERRWVQHFRALGARLTNATDGGDGTPGLIPGPETRARMSAAHKGRKMPPEAVAKMAAALRGRKQSAAHIAKLSAVRKGRAPIAACKAAAKAKRGKPHSAEHRARIAAANRGRVSTGRKLTPSDVRFIRANKGVITQRALAERFGVAVATVCDVQQGRRYAEVKFSPHCLPIEQQRGLFEETGS